MTFLEHLQAMVLAHRDDWTDEAMLHGHILVAALARVIAPDAEFSVDEIDATVRRVLARWAEEEEGETSRHA